MKSLSLLLTLAAFILVHTSAQTPRPAQDPKKAAARAYLFQDPHRKIKNDKGQSVTADLRPLFAWVNARKGGTSPMPAWKRFEVTVTEHLKDGMLVTNTADSKMFFIKNYPRKLPTGTMIQLFVLDIGTYEYKPPGATPLTLHAFDYGTPYNPATEKKSPPPAKQDKDNTSSQK
ncbi:MAG: hypothetical protein ACXW3Z_08385 [Limisphaerales bacterium]